MAVEAAAVDPAFQAEEARPAEEVAVADPPFPSPRPSFPLRLQRHRLDPMEPHPPQEATAAAAMEEGFPARPQAL